MARHRADVEPMRSPINWVGSKAKSVKLLASLAPKGYREYLEPYFGGGSMLFQLPPAEVETCNDLDGRVINFYRVLRDERLFKELRLKAELTPCSRGHLEQGQVELSGNPVEDAWRFYVACRQSMMGNILYPNWFCSATASRRGMSIACSSYLSGLDGLDQVHVRLRRVQFEQADALRIIERYAVGPSCFCFLDPPYASRGRTTKVSYGLNGSDEHRRGLEDLLLDTRARVMLCAGENDGYPKLEEAGWRKISMGGLLINVHGIRSKAREEKVLLNYTPDGM